MFSRCFKKLQNIVQTMHLTMSIAHPYLRMVPVSGNHVHCACIIIGGLGTVRVYEGALQKVSPSANQFTNREKNSFMCEKKLLHSAFIPGV